MPRIPGFRWDLTPAEAIADQTRLSTLVEPLNRLGEIKHVAGIDVGMEEKGAVARAAVVVLTFPELELVDVATARRPVTFPYVPGLLAYRELPAVFDAMKELRISPDLLIVDGHGRAHPRRFGIACHLGVLLDCPSIGCAKSILVGKANPPANQVGAQSPLVHQGETVGSALRTKLDTSPVYVSIGHRVDLATSCALVMKCCKGYRLPEPTRLAHQAASGSLRK